MVDYHPKGNLSTSYEFRTRAFSPHGSSLAYGIFRKGVASFETDSRVVLITDDDAVSLPKGITNSGSFSLLDEETLLFARFAPELDPEGERITQYIVRQRQQERIIGEGGFGPYSFDGFSQSERLFFVGGDRDELQLWTVQLNDPNARAESVPLDGSVITDSVLKQGRARPPPYQGTAQTDVGQALLLATSESDECYFVSQRCQMARWVVTFEPSVQVIRLDDLWLKGTVTWAPDGSGLLVEGETVGEDGLSFIPAPTYRGSFELEPGALSVHLPERWPAQSP